MRLDMNGFKVEIKARHTYHNKYNEADTYFLLNWISTFAREAAKQYEREGATALASMARKTADEIFDTLDAAGAYKFK